VPGRQRHEDLGVERAARRGEADAEPRPARLLADLEAQAALPATAVPAVQPEAPAEPKRAKKPAPRIGAKRAPAKAKEAAKADGEKKPARKAADAPAPKTTVKRARKIVKDDGGEKKE